MRGKTGRLAVENDFCCKGSTMSPKERRKMVNKTANISLSRQCKILRISRSSLYYAPIGLSPETLELMRQIDKAFTQYPFFLWSPDCGLFTEKTVSCRSSSYSALDEKHGVGGDLQVPQHQQKAPREPDLSISAQKFADHPRQSSPPLGHVNMPCRAKGAPISAIFR